MAKEAEGKKKGKSKLIVIIAVVALAGVGAKFFLLGGGKAKAATPPPPAKPGPVVDVGDMTINLADQSPRYAAVSMSLELTATGSSDEVTKGIPILKDAALKKLSAHIKRRKLEFHAISAVIYGHIFSPPLFSAPPAFFANSVLILRVFPHFLL